MSLPLRALRAPQPVEEVDAADLEAVARCLAGDRRSFETVVRRHGRALFAFCTRIVGAAVGEELAQETFARAYSNLGSFRQDAQLKHWLYRIALNLCRDHLKSGRAKEDAVGHLPISLEPVDESNDPERRALGREAVGALEAALEALPPKYREAFVLKHVENLSYEDMQEIVRMPIPALKVRVHRAREMLKKRLALGEGEEEGR